MSKAHIFDFPVFYTCFLDSIANRYGLPEYEIMNHLFDGQANGSFNSTTASQNKTGQRPISKKQKEKLKAAPDGELKKRFEYLINLDIFNEREHNSCIADIQSRFCTFYEAARNEDILILNPQKNFIMASLSSSDYNIYEMLSELLLLSLEVSSPKKRLEDFKDLSNLMSGEFTRLSEDKSSNSLERYIGLYYIYYYSAHYENDVHCGLLRIFSDKPKHYSARLIFGLNSISKLSDSLLLNSINADDSTQAKILFDQYQSSYKLRYDARFYLFNGVVSANDYYLNIDFIGTGTKADHRQTLILNITRAAAYKSTSSYKGGLGLVMVSPNRSTPKIRVFRMGVSDVLISLDNPKLKELLKLVPNNKQRVEVQKDDDSSWWDFMLQCEAQDVKK